MHGFKRFLEIALFIQRKFHRCLKKLGRGTIFMLFLNQGPEMQQTKGKRSENDWMPEC
jgi:hypothetical protein